jgi:uncharacterized protein involved in exopolysaccharide biosynthesis
MAGERAPENMGAGLSGGLDAELHNAVGSQMPTAYVVMFVADQPQRICTIKSATILLGRSPDAEVNVGDASVSAHHARIVWRNQGFEIVDLDSTNGTFVAGKRVSRSPLRNADQVTLGSVDFIFLLDRPTMATIRLPDRIGRISTSPRVVAAAVMPTIAPAPAMARVPDQEGEGPSLADMLRKAARGYAFIRDRSLLLAAFAIAGAVLGVLSLFVFPPGVAAMTEVRLTPHMTLTANPSEDPWQNSERDSGTFVKGAERVLGQPDNIRATLRKLTGQEFPDARLGQFAARIKVEEIGDHTFRVTYKDKLNAQPPPQEYLSLLLRSYVQSDIARSVKELNAKVEFLHDQLSSVEGDVQRVSGERAVYREQNADHLPEDSQQTHSSRFDLETRRVELSSQLHQLEGELAAAEEQLRTNKPDAQRRFQWSESYRQALTEVNRKLSEAYARGLGDAHPEVLALKEEKQRLDKLLRDELQSPTSALVRDSDPNVQLAKTNADKLRAQIAATRANLGETEKNLAQVRRVVRELPRVEQHLADLDHRQEATMQLHSELFSKLKQAEIQLNLEKVSAESRYDVSPVRLERSRNRSTLAMRGGLGLALGLLLAGLGIAVLEAKRFVSRTLSTPAVLSPDLVTRGDRPSKRSF